ncbi:MAG: hypothetical protein KGZ92_01405 [Firmicutes bacterium]|nr:hypothetical protein [Dethiobacter sp.]MBS3887943.1 hypothetical protein [Bacillota bacterium]
MKVRIFIVLMAVAFLAGYLTLKQKQSHDTRADIEFAAGVEATVTTVMQSKEEVSIWRHGDRLAYEANGRVGLVAPRGKGQRIYTASQGQFVSGSLSYVITRDGGGIYVHTRRGSFLLPNSAGEKPPFGHLWSNGLLYYTLSTEEAAHEAFLGLFVYNPETQTNTELLAGQEGYSATSLAMSPAENELMLILRPSFRTGELPLPSHVWIYDLVLQKGERVEVPLSSSDEAGRPNLSGPLTWASDSLVAVGLRSTTDDSFAGTAVYSYNDGELRLARVLPDKLTVMAVIQGSNLLVLTELLGIAGDGSFIERQIWLYDPATDQLTTLIDPPSGHSVASAAYHEASGSLFLLRQTLQEGEELSLTIGSFVDASGRETPLFTAHGKVTEAVWVGHTLYVVMVKPEEGYRLKRITFPRP